MERDVGLSHGIAGWLKERLGPLSDKFTVPVCQKCGLIAEADTRRKVNYCRLCDDFDHVKFIETHYAAKLLFQELMSMMILPRFRLE